MASPSIRKEIFINSTLNEIRVAILENGRLAELFWELPDKERNIGNIYLGRVQRIVQGMNAAFIDIGMRQDGFLHFSDVGELDEVDDDDDANNETPPTPMMVAADANNDDEEDMSDASAIALRRKAITPTDGRLPTFATKRSGQVTINIEVGQLILVQVTREGYGSKGLRVTTKISLPGRYLVLLPFSPSIGVSKKIWNIRERKRLRAIAASIIPEGGGCIVRTEAQEQDDETFRKDLQDLLTKWNSIHSKVKELEDQPGLLHKDMSMAQGLIRDLLTADVQHVTLDSRKLYNDIRAYAEWAAPRLAPRVRLYTGVEPMFDAFGLKNDIDRSSSRVVGLPSGGYLVWDHTEAMTVVDVNSGRFAGSSDQESNSMRTNIEAVREIARQIRIRDIGGMIVVDCIDVQDERNRRRLVEEMYKDIANDRAQVVIYPLTQLGLMQLTRQRVRQNIMQVISEPCPTCNGAGTIPSKSLVMSSIERWLKNFTSDVEIAEAYNAPQDGKAHPRYTKRHKQAREFKLILRVHPRLATTLAEGTISRLARLMLKFFIKISLEQDESLKFDEFRFFSVRRQRDITTDYR